MTEEAKEARKEYMRKWQVKNREHVNDYMKKWRSNNPDKVKQYNESYWERKVCMS